MTVKLLEIAAEWTESPKDPCFKITRLKLLEIAAEWTSLSSEDRALLAWPPQAFGNRCGVDLRHLWHVQLSLVRRLKLLEIAAEWTAP